MLRTALLAVCIVAMSATAVSAEVVFNGSIGWRRAENCQSNQAGQVFTSTYRPRLAGINFDATGLTHLSQFGGYGYKLVRDDFSTVFKNVQAHAVTHDGWSWSGTQVRVTSRTPATITSTTRTVILNGQIKMPGYDLGVGGLPCVVTFEAAYVRGN